MSVLIRHKGIVTLASIFLSLGVSVLASDDMTANGFVEAADAFKNGRFIEATTQFKSLAESGNATAQYNYAALLFKGLGAPIDFEEAWFWAWRARLGGITNAIDLTNEIKSELSQEKEYTLVERLNTQYEQLAYEGDVSAISYLTILNFYALTEPNCEKSYIWGLVAQAFGRTDVQSIISDCSDVLDIEQKILKQKEAKKLFDKLRK